MRKDTLWHQRKRLSTIDELSSSSAALSSPPLRPLSGGNEPATVTPPFLVLCLLLLLLILRAACANYSLTITFLYPAYASYKALQSRPRRTAGTSGAASAAAGALTGLSGSDAEVERWLMYWAVVGVWAGVEGCVGWVLTWYVCCGHGRRRRGAQRGDRQMDMEVEGGLGRDKTLTSRLPHTATLACGHSGLPGAVLERQRLCFPCSSGLSHGHAGRLRAQGCCRSLSRQPAPAYHHCR